MDVLKEQINNETQMDIVFCSSFVVLLDLRQIPFSSVVAVVFVAFYFILFFICILSCSGKYVSLVLCHSF